MRLPMFYAPAKKMHRMSNEKEVQSYVCNENRPVRSNPTSRTRTRGPSAAWPFCPCPRRIWRGSSWPGPRRTEWLWADGSRHSLPRRNPAAPAHSAQVRSPPTPFGGSKNENKVESPCTCGGFRADLSVVDLLGLSVVDDHVHGAKRGVSRRRRRHRDRAGKELGAFQVSPDEKSVNAGDGSNWHGGEPGVGAPV